MELESQRISTFVLGWRLLDKSASENDKWAKNIDGVNSRSKAVPAMLQNNGLMMTLITLEASTVNFDPDIARFICRYLHEEVLGLNWGNLSGEEKGFVHKTVPKIQLLSLSQYLFAQNKVAQLVNWIKQITQAQKQLLPKKQVEQAIGDNQGRGNHD